MKYLKLIIITFITAVILMALAGMYKFNYLSNQPDYDIDGNKISMHSSWDIDKDGINDCENDGTCDHTVDYSKPRK